MSAFEQLADLPVEVSAYELEGHDREYGSFTRPSTIVRLRGSGQEGIGEDVVYDVLDHIAHRDAGPVHDLSGPGTLGGLCELLAELDLFSTAAPVREASRHYRRWAYESAALDLALRQSGASLHEALGRDPKPVTFVCSTRLSSFGDDDARSTTGPVRRRLDKYPSLRFKLDPENDWDADLIAELAEIAGVDVLDLKGHYRGTPVDVETDPELYRAVAEAFPSAYLEDPDLNDETRPVLEPHADRVTWDAAAALAGRHRGAGARAAGDQLEAVALRLPGGAVRRVRALRAARHCDLRRRPGRARPRARPDPVPRLALSPRHPERHRSLGLQRPGGPRRAALQPARTDALGDGLSLGRVGGALVGH